MKRKTTISRRTNRLHVFDGLPSCLKLLEYYGIRNEIFWWVNACHGYLNEHKKSSSMVFAQTQPLCCLVFLRVSPYINHSAVYILFLVLWDQHEYSEKSEINDWFRRIF